MAPFISSGQRISVTLLWLAGAALALAGELAPGPGAARGGDIVIQRDRWGVPHIFAETLADGAYGLGFAQAEDRLEQLFANYRQAAGRAAEVGGANLVEQDFQQFFDGHEAVCRRRYPELPGEVRQLCEAFQEGINAYVAQHPEKLPFNSLEMEPWMIPALARMLVFNWPKGAAAKELARRDGKTDAKFPLFSNQWAVRPERTAEGAGFLLIDPHVPWDGPFRFYEFRLHAGGQDLSGFAPVGTPFLGLGHNAFLGWACTTGGPDTTDVYVEQMDPANPKRYRYDGGWRELSTETVAIRVKGGKPVERTLERSHHGPIALREGNRAYAVACPYFDQIDLVTQLYRMMTARDLAGFEAALAMCQFQEQNIMYADVAGNIRYVRTGRVPVRPRGFDFSRPVPGHTSESEWQGLHSFADLVQFLNPPSGYLQNCNIGPDTMARGLVLDRSRYASYLVNCAPGVSNSRGRRAVELLEGHPRLTVEEAMAIALDTHAEGCEHWQGALRRALQKVPLESPRAGVEAATLRRCADQLLTWNGFMDQGSAAATLYRGWRLVAADRKLGADSPAPALLDALADTAAWLAKHHGSVEVPYGQVHRLRRGDQSWPVSGGDSGGGMTLRAISAEMDGTAFYGHAGQNWLQLVQFRPDGVRSWTLTPYGQSDDPASPHYADQAEKLFSRSELKPSCFQPAELESHLASTQVLRRGGEMAGGSHERVAPSQKAN